MRNAHPRLCKKFHNHSWSPTHIPSASQVLGLQVSTTTPGKWQGQACYSTKLFWVLSSLNLSIEVIDCTWGSLGFVPYCNPCNRIHRSLGHRLSVVVKYNENALVLLWGLCQWDKFIRPSIETWDSTCPLLVKRSHLFLVINNTLTRIQWSLKPSLSFVIRNGVLTIKISVMV